MENYKEKSKVEMSLKDYLDITEAQQEFNKKINVLKIELFKGFEMNNKKEIIFSKYNLSSQKIHNLIKEVFPEDYEIIVKSFNKNSTDEDE